MKRRVLIATIFLTAVTIWLAYSASQPQEPTWGGHRLSEWLDAYDSNLRFPDDPKPRSGFSDAEIERALNGIGNRALPFLWKWLNIEHDDAWRWKIYFFMWNHHLMRYYNFQPQTKDWRGVAFTGFMYYGTNALPLFPKLEKLTHSRNEDVRLRAFGVAFFTLPPKQLFLPLADRLLQDPKNRVMAAQWMAERFPDEADKRGLLRNYPYFFDQTNSSSQ